MNRETAIARAALAALILFVCLAFVPSQAGMDMMRVGFALVAGCVFFSIASAVTWLVFRRRAKMVDRFLAGRDILARWEIPAPLWSKHVAADLEEEKSDKKALFLISAAWVVVIGGAFLLYDPDAGRWVAGVLALTLLILVPFAFWLPRLRAAKLLRRPTPVVIGRDGAFVGGELHDWRLAGSFFDHAEIDDKTEPRQLHLHYAYIGGRGVPVPSIVRLPIPPDKEAEARHVVEELTTLKGHRRHHG